MTKEEHLDRAEIFDSWRVVPRIVLAIYLTLFSWCVVYYSTRYFHLSPAERTSQITAYATAVLTVMSGAFPFILKIYMDTGRDWDAAKRPATVVTQQNNNVV